MTLSNLSTDYAYDSYKEDLYELLKRRENDGLQHPGIHGDEGGTKGDPAIGYGFDINTWEIDQIENALTYAFDDPQTTAVEQLTALQQAGVDIIADYKTEAISAATLISIAKGNSGTAAQKAALQSLEMTDAQATRLLDLVLEGSAGKPGFEDGGFAGFENELNTKLEDDGGLAQSRERVAVISMYYNLPELVGGGLQHAIATDNRAEGWYEIRYHHENYDDLGAQERRTEESDIFGLVSVDGNIEEVKEALSFLFNGTDAASNNIYQLILSRDKHDPFVDAIQDEMQTLTSEFNISTDMHFVQTDFSGNDTDLNPGEAEGHSANTNNLMFGQDGSDTLHGGAGDDALFGDFGSCDLDSGLTQPSNDVLYGDAGNDTLVGGAGDDKLEGGGDDDIIYGDDHAQLCEPFGADTMTGGSGNDKFIIEGNDVITDPEVGDRIGFLDGDEEPIWLVGGYLAGGDEEDAGDGREEYTRVEGLYYEETHYGTVAYEWEEGSDCLTIILPDESVIHVEDWANGKAGIHLDSTPDDDKFDQSPDLTSPLVLDLDGDGIELIEALRSETYFDVDNDGFAERMGWVAPDDGLLALDLNSNGTIDSLAELFGVQGNWDYEQLQSDFNNGKLPTAFDTLRALDSNSDDVIDSADPVFADLKVWQDLNGDGISQAGELSSLSALGIASLSLTTTPQFVGDGTNALTDFGTFTRIDNSTGDLVDVWFGYDGHLTKDLTPTAVDPATANLPKLHGYGEAGSLSEAMSADTQLLNMVTDFKNLTVADARQLESRVEDILLRWYGADGIDPLSRGDNVDGRWITALEHIYGDPWRNDAGSGNPNGNGGGLLAEAWRDYKSTIMVQLLAQTPLGQTLFPGLAFAGAAFLTLPDTFSLEDALSNLSANSPTDGIEKLQYWHSMLLALDALYPEFKELMPPPGEEEEEVDFEPIFVDAIETALAANGISYSYDQLRGGNLGTDGDDVLLGVSSAFSSEDSTVADEPLLVGGDGNDTYRIGTSGIGATSGIVVEGADGGADTVQTWVTYTLTDNVENLTLLGTGAINGTGNELGNIIVGNTNGNILTGLDGADTLQGGSGNDTLQGGDGADSIELGSGKDRVAFGNVLEAGDIVTGFGTSGTEQDTINLDALFDALNGGIASADRAGRVQLVETGTDVELRIDTGAGTGAGDGIGDVTLMVFAGMTSAAGLFVGTLSTSDIQVGTA